MATEPDIRGIILADLDRTLIDETYGTTDTDESIPSLVCEIQTAGWAVGLNSDTPLQSLRRHAGEFRMQGPLIGENGAVLEWHPYVPKEKLVEFDASAARFELLKAWSSAHSDALMIVGDVVRLVSADPQLPDLDHAVALLVNGLRETSLAFYVRMLSSGKLVLSTALLAEAGRLLEDTFATPGRVIETDPDYGYATVRPINASKDRGVARLLELVDVPMVYMIGDSANDIIDSPHVRLCAVGNAEDCLKRRAWFTARQGYTSGVIEILRAIQRTQP